MKCFIHFGEEAIAACKKCGKGMCANCSSYSGHSGICPECRKLEFQQEVANLRQEKKKNILHIVLLALGALLGVILAFLAGAAMLILTGIFGIAIAYKAFFPLKRINNRIAYLVGEITKLDQATAQGNAHI